MRARAFPPPKTSRKGPLFIAIAFFALLFASRFIASTILDFEWWKEINQLDTWLSLLLYSTAPIALATLLLLGAFMLAWKLGERHASGGSGRFARMPPTSELANRLIPFGLLLLAIVVANLAIDSWTVVRYFGGARVPGAATGYLDPIFGKPLRFYFFDLPFYNLLLRVVLAGSLISLLIYWLTSHFRTLIDRWPQMSEGGGIHLDGLSFGGAFDSRFIRIATAILLLGLAAEIFFDRYDLLFEDHGTSLVGVDYVADHITIPLQWLLIVGAVVAAALVTLRRGRLALVLLLLLPIRFVLPPLIGSIYVRPNELALQRPYIGHHIEATRSAYALNTNVKEQQLAARAEIRIDYETHKPLLDNVRLWDWRAFHDTVSQIQPLRPYTYVDTDIDRYRIDGSLRQVLISSRELDISQLGEGRQSWINPHLIYTHGYGVVMAEANRITSDGLPQLFIEDAPPKVTTPSLKFTEPQIYFGETEQEPVFVSTSQPEFDYPSGSENVHTRYKGKGGFPISPLLTRLSAALTYGDPNILLTNYFTPTSRMMIRRRALTRLSTMAGFLSWERDPYIVLTSTGRLAWMVDGYMTSTSHPYSREVATQNIGAFNYIRNSVKATIDAYSGETHLYVFDARDPLIQAYGQLFPKLLEPASAMPADLREHARYPETLFSTQADIYRAYHMRDPEAFFNRADLWDLAKTSNGRAEAATAVSPTYVVATLPGSNTPEFLLFTPFTPANKDNLIGMMLARCDGANLGQLIFEQLGKQDIIYGPKQIEAFINQDQTISKDLTLWNQQGSEVLRGQILVLPIDNSFLYVEPIYIQASGARMPQLKKVALAMGNKLAYDDSYEKALARLIGQNVEAGTPAPNAQAPAPESGRPVTQTGSPGPDALREVRDHFNRYRDLNSQGKFSEAGKELETIQRLLNK